MYKIDGLPQGSFLSSFLYCVYTPLQSRNIIHDDDIGVPYQAETFDELKDTLKRKHKFWPFALRMTVESPIFTRKLKILPKVPAESESQAWSVNEKNHNESSSEIILNASGYYELETFIQNNDNTNETDRLNRAVVKTSVNDVKVRRQTYSDGFGGIGVYKKFNDSSVNKNRKSFHLKQCCPWATPWILLTNSMLQVPNKSNPSQWMDCEHTDIPQPNGIIIIFCVGNDDVFEKLVYSPVRRKEIWRYFSYNFLHSDAVHLFINVFIQLLVAFPLETEQGHWKVFVVYFIGVISGGIGASVFQPDLLMVGASAGVYSLLISHISHISLNFGELSYRYFRIASVIVLCIGDIIFVINHCLTRGNSEPKIS
ncbi:Protein rhomboid, partial [Pseudolycoriella hygida]